MLDFDVQRCTRRCFATERELRAGETFYSVLVSEGANVVRRDYASDAWPGPPEKALGWWKSVYVDAAANRLHWAPNDVMLSYFEGLEGNATAADARYVLALLLVRRRVLRVERTESDDAGLETLVLFNPRSEVEYRVSAEVPSEDRVQAIQNDLAQLLQTGNGATAS